MPLEPGQHPFPPVASYNILAQDWALAEYSTSDLLYLPYRCPVLLVEVSDLVAPEACFVLGLQ